MYGCVCVCACVFVAAGLLHAENAELALQHGLRAPEPQLLLLVSAQHCPLTPVLVHQPERNVALTSAVNVPATFLSPQSSYISVNPKKDSAWQEDKVWFCVGRVYVCVVCVTKWNRFFPDIQKPSFSPHHRREPISVWQRQVAVVNHTHANEHAHTRTYTQTHLDVIVVTS